MKKSYRILFGAAQEILFQMSQILINKNPPFAQSFYFYFWIFSGDATNPNFQMSHSFFLSHGLLCIGAPNKKQPQCVRLLLLLLFPANRRPPLQLLQRAHHKPKQLLNQLELLPRRSWWSQAGRAATTAARRTISNSPSEYAWPGLPRGTRENLEERCSCRDGTSVYHVGVEERTDWSGSVENRNRQTFLWRGENLCHNVCSLNKNTVHV